MLCTYGPPNERKPRWLLKFDDPDKGDMHFEDEAEAMGMWDRCKDNWTCTLFVTAEFVRQPMRPADVLRVFSPLPEHEAAALRQALDE